MTMKAVLVMEYDESSGRFAFKVEGGMPQPVLVMLLERIKIAFVTGEAKAQAIGSSLNSKMPDLKVKSA
jgi:hypothetical protein